MTNATLAIVDIMCIEHLLYMRFVGFADNQRDIRGQFSTKSGITLSSRSNPELLLPIVYLPGSDRSRDNRMCYFNLVSVERCLEMKDNIISAFTEWANRGGFVTTVPREVKLKAALPEVESVSRFIKTPILEYQVVSVPGVSMAGKVLNLDKSQSIYNSIFETRWGSVFIGDNPRLSAEGSIGLFGRDASADSKVSVIGYYPASEKKILRSLLEYAYSPLGFSDTTALMGMKYKESLPHISFSCERYYF